MYKQLPPLLSSAPSYVRYFAVLALATFIGYRLTTLLAADIVSTQASRPNEPREFSRVEIIMHARDTAYVQLPTQPAVLPLHVEEPKVLASNLAVGIDRAESNDAAVHGDERSNQTTRQIASIRAPSAKVDINRKTRATAITARLEQPKITAQIEPELQKSRSPVPEPQVEAIASLKAAVQAETSAKSEPISKKLARRAPNAGELVRMQLLNQI